MKKYILRLAMFLILSCAVLMLGSCSGAEEECRHNWGEWTVQKEPNCNEGGYSTRTCSLCGADDRMVINATGHTYSEEWADDETGRFHYHPSICQHSDLKKDWGAHVYVGGECSICFKQRVSQGLAYKGVYDTLNCLVSGVGTCLDSGIIVGSTYNEYYNIVGIAEGAFRGCTDLVSVVMKTNITEIGSRAFEGARSLQWVSFTSELRELGSAVFSGCTSLERVYFDGTQAEWDSIRKAADWADGAEFEVVFDSPAGEVIINTACEHSFSEWKTVVEGACAVGGRDERVCTLCSAYEVRYPHTFTDVWSYDGQHHWRTSTCIHADIVADYGEHSFVDNICTVCSVTRVSQGLDYRGILGTQTYLVEGIGDCLDARVVVGRTYNGYAIVGLDDAAFAHCKGLAAVYLQENILLIGDGAFSGSTELEVVQLRASTQHIGSAVFSGCTALRKIEFIGTRAEWEAIEKADDWAEGLHDCYVLFLDGNYLYIE